MMKSKTIETTGCLVTSVYLMSTAMLYIKSNFNFQWIYLLICIFEANTRFLQSLQHCLCIYRLLLLLISTPQKNIFLISMSVWGRMLVCRWCYKKRCLFVSFVHIRHIFLFGINHYVVLDFTADEVIYFT